MDDMSTDFGIYRREEIQQILSVLLSSRERLSVTRDQRYWWEGEGKKAIDYCYEMLRDPKDMYEN